MEDFQDKGSNERKSKRSLTYNTCPAVLQPVISHSTSPAEKKCCLAFSCSLARLSFLPPTPNLCFLNQYCLSFSDAPRSKRTKHDKAQKLSYCETFFPFLELVAPEAKAVKMKALVYLKSGREISLYWQTSYSLSQRMFLEAHWLWQGTSKWDL